LGGLSFFVEQNTRMRKCATIAAAVLACASDAQADLVMNTVNLGNPG